MALYADWLNKRREITLRSHSATSLAVITKSAIAKSQSLPRNRSDPWRTDSEPIVSDRVVFFWGRFVNEAGVGYPDRVSKRSL